jgi:hypothetical protein
MSLSALIQDILARVCSDDEPAPAPVVFFPPSPPPTFLMAGISYFAVSMTGRCANGAQRDQGHLAHEGRLAAGP